MGDRLSQETIDALIELREVKRWSIDAIAARIGCSRSTVSYQLNKVGADPMKGQRLPTRRRNPYDRGDAATRVRAFTLEEDLQILELRQRGMSHTAIGRRLDRKAHTVLQRQRALARHLELGTALGRAIEAAQAGLEAA